MLDLQIPGYLDSWKKSVSDGVNCQDKDMEQECMSMFMKGQSAEYMEQSERENVKMWSPWGNGVQIKGLGFQGNH